MISIITEFLSDGRRVLTEDDFIELMDHIHDLERRLAEKQAEIEAMRPLAEWAKNHPQFPHQYPMTFPDIRKL